METQGSYVLTSENLTKAAAYRRHARECHTLARHAQNEDQRLQLLVMAETWESLAVEREAKLLLN